MTVILQAPADLIKTTTILPDPQFDDTEDLVGEINRKRSMNNIVYSTIKTTNRSVLKYTFLLLSRKKLMELYVFMLKYYFTQMRLTNHKGEVWYVYVQTPEPAFEYAMADNSGTIVLEFEGYKVA